MLKLNMREYHVSGRYGYHALDADHGGATITTGITKKLANEIKGIIHEQINHFCRLNRLATLLSDLDKISWLIKSIELTNVSANEEEREAARRVYNWVIEHLEQPDTEERKAYLSVDTERYDQESLDRKAAQL